MKVLVVAYYFPPFGGGASERFHYFVKYLPDCGITPLVLTVDEECYEDIYCDLELAKEYPVEVELYRSSVLFGKILKRQKSQALVGEAAPRGGASIKRTIKKVIKGLMIPDEQVFWVPRALAKARQIFRDHDICAIIATAPPFSSHLVGRLLSRKYGVPLLVDYRDLWHQNPAMLGDGFKAAINGYIESKVLKKARIVSCTNQAAAEALVGHCGLDSHSIYVVENGFDGRKMEKLTLAPVAGALVPDRIRITYLGSLTKERTPKYFLAALKRFMADHPMYVLDVNFVGFAPAEHRQLVEDLGLIGQVRFYGTVTKEVALDIMCNQTEILLLFQRSTEGGATAIPGKLYEYLATGKPILCMDEGHGITSCFLKGLGIDQSVEYHDEEAIYAALRHVICDYLAVCKAYAALKSKIAGYDREQLTQRFAELVKKIAQ